MWFANWDPPTPPYESGREKHPRAHVFYQAEPVRRTGDGPRAINSDVLDITGRFVELRSHHERRLLRACRPCLGVLGWHEQNGHGRWSHGSAGGGLGEWLPRSISSPSAWGRQVHVSLLVDVHQSPRALWSVAATKSDHRQSIQRSSGRMNTFSIAKPMTHPSTETIDVAYVGGVPASCRPNVMATKTKESHTFLQRVSCKRVRYRCQDEANGVGHSSAHIPRRMFAGSPHPGNQLNVSEEVEWPPCFHVERHGRGGWWWVGAGIISRKTCAEAGEVCNFHASRPKLSSSSNWHCNS